MSSSAERTKTNRKVIQASAPICHQTTEVAELSAGRIDAMTAHASGTNNDLDVGMSLSRRYLTVLARSPRTKSIWYTPPMTTISVVKANGPRAETQRHGNGAKATGQGSGL